MNQSENWNVGECLGRVQFFLAAVYRLMSTSPTHAAATTSANERPTKAMCNEWDQSIVPATNFFLLSIHIHSWFRWWSCVADACIKYCIRMCALVCVCLLFCYSFSLNCSALRLWHLEIHRYLNGFGICVFCCAHSLERPKSIRSKPIELWLTPSIRWHSDANIPTMTRDVYCDPTFVT